MKDKRLKNAAFIFQGNDFSRDIQSGRYKHGIFQRDIKCKVGMTGKDSPCQNIIKYSAKPPKILALIPSLLRSFLISFSNIIPGDRCHRQRT